MKKNLFLAAALLALMALPLAAQSGGSREPSGQGRQAAGGTAQEPVIVTPPEPAAGTRMPDGPRATPVQQTPLPAAPPRVWPTGAAAFELADGGRTLVKYLGNEANVIIPGTVTTIRERAFERNEYIRSVTIPSSVTKIEGSAFESSGLTSVVIPSSVVLRSGGSDESGGMFVDCASLTSVTLPNTAEAVVQSMFSGCTSLRSITIPSSVTQIGAGAFARTGLTSITIPSSVTQIGASAFERCTSLTSVTIPSSVTQIGASAFERCTSLTSVTIPSSVTQIGASVFERCTSLTSVTFPNSVTPVQGYPYLASYMFSGCTSLTSIRLPEGITGTLYPNMFDGCTNLRSVNIPSGITSIYKEAFRGCTSLTGITLPQGLRLISERAFKDSGLSGTLALPGSVAYIYEEAFAGTRLSGVDIAYKTSVSRNVFPSGASVRTRPDPAVNSPYVLTAGRVSARPGEKAAVSFNLNHPGLTVFDMAVTYDTTRLEIQGPGDITLAKEGLRSMMNYLANDNGSSNGMGRPDNNYMHYPLIVKNVMIAYGIADRTEGEILSLRFTVKPNAPAGEAFVNVKVIDASSVSGEVLVRSVNSAVTVTR